MKNKRKKEITMDMLAGMVQRGFEESKKEQNRIECELRKEMNEIESRIDTKFAKVDAQFIDLDNKLQTYTSFWHRKFSEHEAWLQNLDRSVANIERQLKK
jgi:hypothetical protein